MIKNKQHIKHLSQEIINHLKVIEDLVDENIMLKNATVSAKCIMKCILDEVDH